MNPMKFKNPMNSVNRQICRLLSLPNGGWAGRVMTGAIASCGTTISTPSAGTAASDATIASAAEKPTASMMMKPNRLFRMFLLAAFLLAGCDSDFLDVTPPASLTEETFFRTAEDAEATITAAYNPLRNSGLYNNNYPKLTEGPSDDIIIHNTQGLSLDSWTFGNDDAIIDVVWQTLYEGIFRSNIALQMVPGIEMNDAQKDRIIGEAHFLRGLYYWHLAALFGDVPLVDTADPSDISSALLPASPVAEVYDFIVADLQRAIELLPAQSALGPENLGRATSGAAEALLGKVYLYAGNYPLAEEHLENVILSGEYQLLDNYADLLVVDNNPESIFEVQFADLADQGTTRLVNNYPQGQGGFANLLPTQELVDEFEEFTGPGSINGRDPRLFHTVFREGDPYDDVSPQFSAAWTPTGYAMKKGLYPVIRFNNSNGARNLPLIRLADVLLMYAEAANENDKPDVAIDAINQVRARVGMPPLPTAEYPAGSKEEIFMAIVHERRVELATEHHRLNDLRRWSLAEEVLTPLGYDAQRHRYFPIPQAEIDNNPNLQ